MRVILVFLILFLSSCASARTYEEIAEAVMITRKFDDFTYQANSWKPIGSNDEFIPNKNSREESAQDQEACVNDYRGIEFDDEVLATTYFIQCMNKKGWHLHTEELIIIGHS